MLEMISMCCIWYEDHKLSKNFHSDMELPQYPLLFAKEVTRLTRTSYISSHPFHLKLENRRLIRNADIWITEDILSFFFP